MLLLFNFFAISKSAATAKALYKPQILTDENFDSKIKKSKLALLLAIDENNTACDEAVPHFRAAASYFNKNRKCDFLILDGAKSPNTTEKLDIEFFPSLYVFREGKKILEYTGNRNASDLAKYVERISNDPVIDISEQKPAYDFLNNNPIVVILQGDEDMDEEILEAYKSVAENLYDFVPFVYASTDIASYQFGLQADQDSSVTSSVIIRRQIDDVFLTFPREEVATEPEKFEEFVRTNIVPLYRTTDGTTFRDIIHSKKWALICFCDTAKKSSMKQVHMGIREVQAKYYNNFSYAYGPIREFVPLLNGIGIEGKKEPLWIFANFTEEGEIDQKLFLPEGTELTPGLLVKFTDNLVLQFPIIPVKSEPIPDPEDNEDELVKKLVGNNFKEVYADGKDKVVIVLSGKTSETTKYFNYIKAIAAEFEKQKCTSISFYYINRDKNDVFIDVPDEKVCIVTVHKNQGTLLPQENDPIKIMKHIVTYLKPSPKVKVPKKLKLEEEQIDEL